MEDEPLHHRWQLSKNATPESYIEWRTNVMKCLLDEEAYQPYLTGDVKWCKKTKLKPHRGFTDDNNGTAVHKSQILNCLLLQIASCCPILSSSIIVKSSTCMRDIWSAIETYFNFNHSTICQLLNKETTASIITLDDTLAASGNQDMLSFPESDKCVKDYNLQPHYSEPKALAFTNIKHATPVPCYSKDVPYIYCGEDNGVAQMFDNSKGVELAESWCTGQVVPSPFQRCQDVSLAYQHQEIMRDLHEEHEDLPAPKEDHEVPTAHEKT